MKEEKIINFIEKTFTFRSSKELLLGAGDDCALLKPIKGNFVITTDEQVEGTHFFSGSAPEFIASKLMRVNLSDLAAMGNVRPISCVVGAGLKSNTPKIFIEKFVKALKKEANKFGLTVSGGNLAGARENHFYMTVWGEVNSKPILRSTAKCGDFLANIGPLGEAKAALHLLKKNSYSPAYGKLIKSFWQPMPQFKAAKILAENKIASAMLDNSDGLYKSAKILAEKSNLRVEIEADKIKTSKVFNTWCKENKINPLAFAIDGGEDYGLVFSVNPRKISLLKKLLPAAQIIGRFYKGCGIEIKNFEGKIESFEHF